VGTVFKLAPNGNGGWTETILHSFRAQSANDGAGPLAGLIMDAAGNLYGATYLGGAGAGGTVFELSTSDGVNWTENVLYSFCSISNCADGVSPIGGVVMDNAGNLYGVTQYAHNGTNTAAVFKLSPGSGVYTATQLAQMCCQPRGGLTMDAAGNLYGNTTIGGSANEGTVFELVPTGGGYAFEVLYTFCTQPLCPDSSNPAADLIVDSFGNLYGTTEGGAYGNPVAFKLSPPTGNGWTYTVLSPIPATTSNLNPSALTMDTAGNLYGTYPAAGSFGGHVFKLSPGANGYTGTVVYTFCSLSNCADGGNPQSGVIIDAAGNLYGTTTNGGNVNNVICSDWGSGCGVIFQLSANGSPTLSVSKSGGGSGTVTSTPQGIDCGATCIASFAPGTQVTLTATAASGSQFAGWGGACSGTGTCTLTMNSSQNVAANFTQITYPLSVSEIGNGIVASSPGAINCPSTCSANFQVGTQVTLTATPAAGWAFTGWSGACSGTGTCTLTMNSSQSVSATFTQNLSYSLSVSLIGGPGGKVTSAPSGIDCGSTCSTSFAAGTQVTLTASPAKGWGLAGWGGVCNGIGGCTVTLNASTSVSASFSTLFGSVAGPVMTSPSDAPALPPALIGPLPND
jgi:uncharacterized repeat protein (TIGR03803 family)